MAAKRTITKDPRWHDFVYRYQDNFELFAEECCLEIPTHQQCELFEAIGKRNNKVSVSSGTGTGKSSGTGILALCFMTTHVNPRVCITANKVAQVMIGVMKNIENYWKIIVARYPWLDDYFTLTDRAFYCNEAKKGWSVGVKGYRVGNEEGLAGEHADHLLYIVDEASGLGDPAFTAITGTLTGKDNRLLLLSQPTRNDGFFYRTQNDLKRDLNDPQVGTYEALVFNSEDSSIVDDSFIATKYVEYGGRDSVEYKIRVRGIFADNQDGMLISRSLVNSGFDTDIVHEEDWGYVFTCDVAGGMHRDSCVLTIARVSGYLETRRVEVVLTKEFAGDVGAVDFARILVKEYTPFYHNVTIGVDFGAMGCEMVKELERQAVPNVVPISWGAPVHAKSGRSKWKNKRAFASDMVRFALTHGNIKIYKGTRLETDKLVKQFIKLPFSYDDNGNGLQLQMMSKKNMAKQGIKSPDIFDTYAFIWLVDYIPAGDTEDDEYSDELGEVYDNYEEYEDI